jgi:hypothetical protein
MIRTVTTAAPSLFLFDTYNINVCFVHYILLPASQQSQGQTGSY